jgi:alpha,alpha-trehalase
MNYLSAIKNDPATQKALKSAEELILKTSTHPDLPHPFVPASRDFFNEQFYWDSYFIMLGLNECEKKGQKIAKNMVENFFWMIEKYGYIPNSYKSYDTRSQPPLLTSMILMIDEWLQDETWLKKAYEFAVKEYNFWHSPLHLTPTDLSRFADAKNENGEALDTENESGWDFTPRYEHRAHRVCPIDLNAMLFKYEKDFEQIAKKLGKNNESENWKTKSATRRDLINKLMWNENDGLFFDYDFEKKEQLKTKSLAAYVPMWAGLTDEKQSKSLSQNLKIFEHSGGLAVTDTTYGSDEQWCYPNGWPPMMWLTIQGLLNYGFTEDADRLTYKWLKLCADEFGKSGSWHEKLAVTESPRLDDKRYKHQTEQYWTMGVFIALYKTPNRI